MKGLMVCFVVLLASFNAAASWSDSKIEYINTCYDIPDEIHDKGEYCFYEDKRGISGDVLYHLHGIFGTAKNWVKRKRHKRLQNEWLKRGIKSPLIVTFSYSRAHLLTPLNRSEKSGLYEKTLKLIRHIEQQIQHSIERRMIYGVSMGAFNAAQLVFRNPKMFDKVLLVSPPMTTITPYASDDEIKAYVKRNRAKKYKVKRALKLSRQHFPSIDIWLKDSPTDYYRQNDMRGLPEIYLSSGTLDDYGFHEGIQGFALELLEKRRPLTWVKLDQAKHGAVDVVAMTDYLFD